MIFIGNVLSFWAGKKSLNPPLTNKNKNVKLSY